jgi:hypothetical protein
MCVSCSSVGARALSRLLFQYLSLLLYLHSLIFMGRKFITRYLMLLLTINSVPKWWLLLWQLYYTAHTFFPSILRPTHIISCNASMSDLYSWTVLIRFFKAPVLYNKSVSQVPIRRHLFWLSRLLIPSGLRLLGFLDEFYRVRKWALRPNTDWRIRPSCLCRPETGWSSHTPIHWGSILDASCETHGLRWSYSCIRPPHGNYLLQ